LRGEEMGEERDAKEGETGGEGFSSSTAPESHSWPGGSNNQRK